jgi:multiple antibiotic resistance protein
MVKDFLQIMLTVFIVMDPIGMIPQYLSVTAPFDEKTRKAIVNKAMLIAFAVLLLFLLGGKFLLEFFGITPGAFYVSGGILFFLIAFGMIYSKPGGHNTATEDDGATSSSVALFPLAIPLIAGPGLLSVIIMFMSGEKGWLYSFLLLFPALLLGLLCTYVMLRCSVFVVRLIGVMGISVLEKIMGIVLSGFAVQFIVKGLTELGIIK